MWAKNSNNIAIRPEAISASKIIFEADEKRYILKAEIVDGSTSGNILSYYVNCSGVNLRVNELYGSFNLFEIGKKIYISFEKRNCIGV